MRKFLVVLGLCVIAIFSLVGCKSDNVTEEYSYIQVNDKNIDINEWVSPDGVHYWIGLGSSRACMSPRYDSNGNLVIDK